MLLGEEMMDIKDLKREGMNIKHIAERTGRDRKTVRKYLARKGPPEYAARRPRPSKLDPFKSYVRMRIDQGMTNGVKMLKEIRGRGYAGGMSILKDFMPLLRPGCEMAVIRSGSRRCVKLKCQRKRGNSNSISPSGARCSWTPFSHRPSWIACSITPRPSTSKARVTV